LIRLAESKGVVLAVFQQTFLAPFYIFAKELAASGKLGDILQVSIRYNGLARRWDWQTLQKKCAGGAYNTGPHPIGIGLGLLDFDDRAAVAYSKLACALTSGDSDDFAKILLIAPEKPVVDIEINSTDAYSGYNLKLQGTRGTFKCTPANYEMTYIVDEENPPRPVQERFLENENHDPIYCSEQLQKHTESGTFNGTAFDVGTATLYEQLYYAITEGKPMDVTPQMAAQIIGVIETVHAHSPLPLKY
jgi:predicted dehydrogenase